jgi:hypothetical protein
MELPFDAFIADPRKPLGHDNVLRPRPLQHRSQGGSCFQHSAGAHPQHLGSVAPTLSARFNHSRTTGPCGVPQLACDAKRY